MQFLLRSSSSSGKCPRFLSCMCCLRPVSYTHLDVYKRQVYTPHEFLRFYENFHPHFGSLFQKIMRFTKLETIFIFWFKFTLTPRLLRFCHNFNRLHFWLPSLCLWWGQSQKQQVVYNLRNFLPILSQCPRILLIFLQCLQKWL